MTCNSSCYEKSVTAQDQHHLYFNIMAASSFIATKRDTGLLDFQEEAPFGDIITIALVSPNQIQHNTVKLLIYSRYVV
jgi:hypothetical protein